MTKKRFELSESVITDYRIYDYKQEDAYFISCAKHTAECLVNLLNSLNDELEESSAFIIEQRKENRELRKENGQLEGKLERKETLLKIRTENNDKIMKSIHQLIIYLENSVYKSDVSAIAVKKDIISLIKKWEVR